MYFLKKPKAEKTLNENFPSDKNLSLIYYMEIFIFTLYISD